MIEVQDLVKKYDNHLAVDHISFQLEKGKVYGFLGPNGAGKSTTMNIMTGYLAATSGTVLIEGHDITKEPEEAKACIGYLPEIPPLYPEMTVEEYLRFAAELKKVPRGSVAHEVETVEKATELLDVRKKLIRSLSKGYRQRVGCAQAMLGDPEVIIWDEPTVGLDPAQIIQIRKLIRALGREHIVILSSHVLTEVSAVCDHIIMISKGRIVANDTLENLQSRARGKSRIELAAHTDLAGIRGILSGVEGIAGIQPDLQRMVPPVAEGESCAVMLTLEENVSRNLCEEIFFRFAANGVGLLELRQVENSLEDVYLDLTGR